MSTFSKTSFKTLNYNSFRPHYPPSFYAILARYIQQHGGTHLPVDTAVDLGCGTGVATYPLLNLARHVIGVDLSPGMIETANSLVDERLQQLGIAGPSSSSSPSSSATTPPPTIEFKCGAVEDFVNSGQRGEIQNGSVDLITAAQCIHWFKDYHVFFASAAQLLKSGGVLAYFYYIDPMIVDFSGPAREDKSKQEILQDAYSVYRKYAYDDPTLIGPHWEQPGRSILKHFCVDVNEQIPRDLYQDVVVNTFKAGADNVRADDSKDLDLKKLKIKLSEYVDYFSTYSGFHNFREKTGRADLLSSDFLKELVGVTGWDLDKTEIDLVWNTGYTFMTKK
ncbi:uncharacterized protein LODBEIA_P04410 [Lodderomyces beijingensis]|uniref:Methyltransferase type 11 domain-containing protein n=1 Tax=Lodderomyces beijingensis TaxID=1775926 RepID=A0ABP0ZFJ3_9ASCO